MAEYEEWKIYCYDKVTSTNDVIKDYCSEPKQKLRFGLKAKQKDAEGWDDVGKVCTVTYFFRAHWKLIWQI